MFVGMFFKPSLLWSMARKKVLKDRYCSRLRHQASQSSLFCASQLALSSRLELDCSRPKNFVFRAGIARVKSTLKRRIVFSTSINKHPDLCKYGVVLVRIRGYRSTFAQLNHGICICRNFNLSIVRTKTTSHQNVEVQNEVRDVQKLHLCEKWNATWYYR